MSKRMYSKSVYSKSVYLKRFLAGLFSSVIVFCPSCSEAAELFDFSQIHPRGFSEEDRPHFKKDDGSGNSELTVNHPEDARGFVEGMKRSLLKQHHKGSFKQVGALWTLTDETTHKVITIKLRHTTPRKKPNLKGAQAAADLFPNNSQLQQHVWHIADQQSNWPVALAYYRRAFDPGPPALSAESLVAPPQNDAERGTIACNCAYMELMMGHYATAVKLLSRAIKLNPTYIGSYKNRALAYRKLHKDDLAVQDESKIKQLEAAKKGSRTTFTQPEGPSSLLLLLVAIGSYESTLDLAERILKKDPHSALAHLSRARALVKMGRPKEALPDYKAVLEGTKNAAAVQDEMAAAERLAKSGMPPYGDLAVLDQAKDGGPRPYRMIINGKKKVMTCTEIAADHKGDYRVYAGLASVYLANGNWKALDSELDKMLTIFPQDSSLIFRKIQAAEGLLKWAEAEKHCSHYLDLVKTDSVSGLKMTSLEYVYTVRGLARRAQKNFSGAEADQSTVVKLAPDSSEAYRDRGDGYMQSGKFALAVADYSKQIELGDTKDGDGYRRRAEAYDKLKKSDLASKDRETAGRLEKTAAAASAAASEKSAPD